MEEDKVKKPIQLPENVIVDIAFENMLKKFIHDTKKSGILEEVRTRRYYIKPSMVKRLAKKGQKRDG
jgi:ribosomal protein S21